MIQSSALFRSDMQMGITAGASSNLVAFHLCYELCCCGFLYVWMSENAVLGYIVIALECTCMQRPNARYCNALCEPASRVICVLGRRRGGGVVMCMQRRCGGEAWRHQKATACIQSRLGVTQRRKHQHRTKLRAAAAMAAPVDTAAADVASGAHEGNDTEQIDWRQQWCEPRTLALNTTA